MGAQARCLRAHPDPTRPAVFEGAPTSPDWGSVFEGAPTSPDWTSVFEAAHRAAGVHDSLLITIDDFQWSDERSTALLHYLVRGAQADGDPLALVVGGRRSTAVSALAITRVSSPSWRMACSSALSSP